MVLGAANLHGISCKHSKIPPPWAFWSNLKKNYPAILNYIEGNGTSNCISDIINTSTLPLVIAMVFLRMFFSDHKF